MEESLTSQAHYQRFPNIICWKVPTNNAKSAFLCFSSRHRSGRTEKHMTCSFLEIANRGLCAFSSHILVRLEECRAFPALLLKFMAAHCIAAPKRVKKKKKKKTSWDVNSPNMRALKSSSPLQRVAQVFRTRLSQALARGKPESQGPGIRPPEKEHDGTREVSAC
jgi:hypothetical protein